MSQMILAKTAAMLDDMLFGSLLLMNQCDTINGTSHRCRKVNNNVREKSKSNKTSVTSPSSGRRFTILQKSLLEMHHIKVF